MKIKDKYGNTAELSTVEKKPYGYQVLINGKLNYAAGKDLFIENGLITLINNQGSKAVYDAGKWVAAGKTNITGTKIKAVASPSSPVIETQKTSVKNILEKVGISGGFTFGARERNIMIIALGVLFTIWQVFKPKKRRRR